MPSAFHSFTITYKDAVYAPAERTDTLPLFHLYPFYTLLSLLHSSFLPRILSFLPHHVQFRVIIFPFITSPSYSSICPYHLFPLILKLLYVVFSLYSPSPHHRHMSLNPSSVTIPHIECFIEGQASSLSYDLAPRQTPSPVRKLVRRHTGRLSDHLLTGEGEGGGLGAGSTPARKPGPL